MLNKIDLIKRKTINYIKDEINKRIGPEGIRQHRDGIISSEAAYYVLFFYYSMEQLEELKNYKFLKSIITRIYRNLELLNFTKETNYDLFSEILYSCESLKLLNSIENKKVSLHLAEYLFPKKVNNKLKELEEIKYEKTKFRHFDINKSTGDLEISIL